MENKNAEELREDNLSQVNGGNDLKEEIDYSGFKWEPLFSKGNCGMQQIKDEDIVSVTGGTNNSNLVMIFLFNLIGIGIEDNVMSYYNEHYAELNQDDLEKVQKRFKNKFGHNIGE